MHAIEIGDAAAVNRELNSGANVNGLPESSDLEGVSPLNAASSNGQLSIVKLLIDRGADVNMPDGWLRTPLTTAAENGQVQVIKLLITHGAHVSDSEIGSYALWRSAVQGKYESVKILLKQGANPNATLKNRMKLIHVVKALNYPEIADLLKQAGARE